MSEITYIKNGKEGKRNIFFRKKDIFSVTKNLLNDKEYTISEDIEWLHMKNCNLESASKFFCKNKDTVVLLENCWFNNINFYGGNIVIEAPKVKGSYSSRPITMAFRNNDRVEWRLDDKEPMNNIISYETRVGVKELAITGTAIDSLFSIYGHIDYVEIKDLNAVNCTFEANNARTMTIKDSKLEKIGIHIKRGNLQIENSTISSNNPPVLRLESESLSMNNTVLESSYIVLPNGNYSPKDGRLYFNDDKESGDQANSRTTMISLLKTIREKAKQGIGDQSTEMSDKMNRYFSPTIKSHQEQIEKYAELIVKEQEEIAKLQSQQEQITTAVENKLMKRKVREIVPTINRK